MELGYARVSTVKQDLDRQIDALTEAGVARERIYVDKKSGATTNRPGLREVTAYAREGDIIVVHTLDRLGRTVRDTLNHHPRADRARNRRTQPRRPDQGRLGQPRRPNGPTRERCGAAPSSMPAATAKAWMTSAYDSMMAP